MSLTSWKMFKDFWVRKTCYSSFYNIVYWKRVHAKLSKPMKIVKLYIRNNECQSCIPCSSSQLCRKWRQYPWRTRPETSAPCLSNHHSRHSPSLLPSEMRQDWWLKWVGGWCDVLTWNHWPHCLWNLFQKKLGRKNIADWRARTMGTHLKRSLFTYKSRYCFEWIQSRDMIKKKSLRFVFRTSRKKAVTVILSRFICFKFFFFNLIFISISIKLQ